MNSHYSADTDNEFVLFTTQNGQVNPGDIYIDGEIEYNDYKRQLKLDLMTQAEKKQRGFRRLCGSNMLMFVMLLLKYKILLISQN